MKNLVLLAKKRRRRQLGKNTKTCELSILAIPVLCSFFCSPLFATALPDGTFDIAQQSIAG